MTRKQNSPPSHDSKQRDRFIEAARKAGASEDEREFDEALKRVAKQKPKDEKKG